jgi:hypothetical protein
VKVVVIFSDHAADASTYAALQRAASLAELAGDVVAVWPDEFGRTRFMAAPQYHAFLRIIDYAQLRAQINGTILCSPL